MKKVRLFLVGAAALAISGCGGGSGSPGPSDALAGGRAALNQLASNPATPSAQALQSAFTLFQQALQQNPGSSQAHFGAAVCLMGADAQQIDSAGVTPTIPPTAAASRRVTTRDAGGSAGSGGAGFVLPEPPSQGDLPPAPPNGGEGARPIPPAHTLGLFWFLDRGLSNPNTLLNMLAPISDLRLGLISYYGYTGDAKAVARRQTLLTDLGTVAQHLQTVEADPNFTMTLPAPDQNGQTVTIGLPEVYLFDAYVQSLRVSTALSLAYNRDPGTEALLPPTTTVGGPTGAPEPPSPPIFSHGGRAATRDADPGSPYAALDKNHDGKLTPDEYLPPSPFLTLRDPAYLHTAQSAMLAIVDRETKGIAGVLARPAAGSFLLPNSADVQTALTNIRDNVLPLIQQAASGPVTLSIPRYEAIPLVSAGGGTVVPGTESNELFTLRPSGSSALVLPQPIVMRESITINVATWFAHPPPDLKVFAPSYVLDSIGYPNFSLTTYPDSTFGGLFPSGLPSDLRF